MPAADGSDLAACQDASCVVEVRQGDRLKINAKFGLDAITVKAIRAKGVTLALRGRGGGLQLMGMNVSVSSTCVNDQCRDEASLLLTTGRPGRVNDIGLRLKEVGSDRAVLALQPN
jgi:hypothetical protein